jgi:hypothetical protein
MSVTFHPYLAAVSARHAAYDCQSQAWSAAFECCFARGVERNTAHLIKLFEYQIVMFRIQPNASICHSDLNAGCIIIHRDRVCSQNDPAAVRRIFYGIDDQLVQCL